MKRFLALGVILGILVSGLTISIAPANAAVVTSECKKVKAQIQTFEAQEKVFEKDYEPVNGIWSWFFTSAHLNKYWNLQKEIVNFEVDMFTYDVANLSCFTLKQQQYALKELDEWKGLQSFIQGTPDWITGFSFIPIDWDSILKIK
ncbi:MAG: hypothetical protein HY050_08065 [Actinobacteria bacterium]|nr:hypothetical protein [Actinomycetota bacterium]